MTKGERGAPGNSGEADRSYLFLSMILLVWNTLETAPLLFRADFPGPPSVTEDMSGGIESRTAARVIENEVSPRHAPLSVRQKYLIGKRIDINKALMEEINELPGISDAMAAAIVAERERMGGFRSPQDLLRVKGVKEKRLKKILPFLEKMGNN